MVGKKILIDPMVPHYQREANSKGGKASHDDSDKAIVPSEINLKNKDDEEIELKAVKHADGKEESNSATDDELKQAEKEGIAAAMRETVRENRRNTFKFFGLMNKSEKLVFRLKNIVPVLPGEVLIDTSKITFIHRPFLFSERIHSISVKDISDVYVETAPFFGTLNVVDSNFTESIVRMNWLWKKEAEKARRIITGLMAASKEQVDLKNIEDDALDEKLEEIGKLRGTATSVSTA